jgi:hypothetical protein
VGAWKKAGINGRRELQTAMFPDGLVWSHEGGFLNSKNAGLMQDLNELFQSLENSNGSVDFIAKIGVPDGI